MLGLPKIFSNYQNSIVNPLLGSAGSGLGAFKSASISQEDPELVEKPKWKRGGSRRPGATILQRPLLYMLQVFSFQLMSHSSLSSYFATGSVTLCVAP